MDLRIFVEPQNGSTYDEQLACAQTAERLGFDAFFRSDHLLSMADTHGAGPTESWLTLGAIARETRRIRLGTMVSSATFRHPSMLAITVAQADAMSGGRVELGLGTGWFEAEHAAYGIPFPPKRFGLFEEQLEVITGLWSTPIGERFSYSGEHYELTDSPALPKPVQSPVPVIVGGGGARRTPELAARFASEYNIGFVDEGRITEQFGRVRAAAEAIGRDPESIVLSVALPTAVGDGWEARARRLGADPETFREQNIGGTAQEAIDKIGRLGELGASRIYLQTVIPSDLEAVEILGAEVLPHV
ncbi:LLM class F420-dependent oxidoreductase [Schumannella sp. 10F1B-5-1]|uniref:LLM class F420-dependent oxidoreductase n=1 Tax=Schumannella sp. 10F1B-5-1 TaxID=2590780 RepID=UPI0011324D52|nr:LLM class F420-dependent oxidoreductase [Schumannella sp. 10F1B-5-1]TPW78442.1 LLM class F420-dependent oxidoreductase [Schumannella sp. 10F1B-5-1]